ncbi:amidohydrolase family protein [Edaphobacter modestus]|uniref:amidohydrolase family protein n=1 Tax=Edaphobacter modestus TaxID=388466 RepID=UPI001F5EC6D1|nr:amidohydrolase family protein [Edaphobacter modestus]
MLHNPVRQLLSTVHRQSGILVVVHLVSCVAKSSQTQLPSSRSDGQPIETSHLGFRQTLAMLTAAPAERFGVSDHEGRIAPGMDADLAILSADPATGDPLTFTQVKYTIRAGRISFHSRNTVIEPPY